MRWWQQCCRWLQHGDGGADVDCGIGGGNIDDNCGFAEDGSRCIGGDRGSSVGAYGYGGGGSGAGGGGGNSDSDADDNVGGDRGADGGGDCKKNEKCQM